MHPTIREKTLRDFILALQVFDEVVHYHCSYAREVAGCGGYIGSVYTDGALFGVPFTDLHSFGSGSHSIQLDDKNKTPTGTKPDWDEGRRSFELFRFVLFGYEHGAFTSSDVLLRALLAFQAPFHADVLDLAPVVTLESLRDYASRIPDDFSTCSSDEFTFFYTSGETCVIPEENLSLLRRTLRGHEP